MNRNEVLARLQPMFRDFFNDDGLVISEQTNAEDIPDWDSLANVNLVLAVERELGIQFDTEEITEFQNVGDMITSILGKSPS
ncbi:MAG: acyl carrier protein [Hyphomonadaceae bacterium]|nr:acyl carrier protein [Hyphomonadaceae bacterium]GIK47445.1 MAG: acyl carrier protein [Alphaproteobacteria bacterium]